MGDTWALSIFATLLRLTSSAVLDVGANVGQTLLKVKSCSAERTWIGFEPNSTCVMYLERLIAVNRFSCCTLDRLVGLQPLKEIGVHDKITWSDYLVIPTERLEETFGAFGFSGATAR